MDAAANAGKPVFYSADLPELAEGLSWFVHYANENGIGTVTLEVVELPLSVFNSLLNVLSLSGARAQSFSPQDIGNAGTGDPAAWTTVQVSQVTIGFVSYDYGPNNQTWISTRADVCYIYDYLPNFSMINDQNGPGALAASTGYEDGNVWINDGPVRDYTRTYFFDDLTLDIDGTYYIVFSKSMPNVAAFWSISGQPSGIYRSGELYTNSGSRDIDWGDGYYDAWDIQFRVDFTLPGSSGSRSVAGEEMRGSLDLEDAVKVSAVLLSGGDGSKQAGSPFADDVHVRRGSVALAEVAVFVCDFGGHMTAWTLSNAAMAIGVDVDSQWTHRANRVAKGRVLPQVGGGAGDLGLSGKLDLQIFAELF